MNKLLIPLLLLISASCQKEAEISGPEKISNRFFETFNKEGPREAVKRLLGGNKYISDGAVDTLGIKIENLTKDLGDFQGVEKISTTTYGKSITQIVYLVKYVRQPLRFNFKFYQPGNGWRIQNFAYEVSFLDEMDDTAKPNFLPENHDR